jgi:hypothetical protein
MRHAFNLIHSKRCLDNTTIAILGQCVMFSLIRKGTNLNFSCEITKV